jgi:hypothetical protein
MGSFNQSSAGGRQATETLTAGETILASGPVQEGPGFAGEGKAHE